MEERKVKFKRISAICLVSAFFMTGCANQMNQIIGMDNIEEPSIQATLTPTPTVEPTTIPTPEPTEAPTVEPTKAPTPEPTKAPTKVPTPKPTKKPTPKPTKVPTKKPTKAPTKTPTKAPTQTPSTTVAPTDTIATAPTTPTITTPQITPTKVPNTNTTYADYINNKGFTSSTKYLVWVETSSQNTMVFQKNQSGKFELVKKMICSTGVNKGTPKGNFKLSSRRWNWLWFRKYNCGAKYVTQLFGNYLFHSFPMDKDKNILDTTLGKPASHGCIRLSVDNAKWIHDNITGGTTIYIN